MLKHAAKIDKNIKTHFTSSNKYFIKHNIYPKRDKPQIRNYAPNMIQKRK